MPFWHRRPANRRREARPMPEHITLGGNAAIEINRNASTPLYRQLYDRLRTQILSGQLEAGTRLSSTRTLAAELGVSRTTTALVYEQLLLEGYVESRVGDGTRVARLHLERRDHGAGGEHRQDAHPPRPSQRGQVLTRTRFPELAYADLGSGLTNLFRVGEP